MLQAEGLCRRIENAALFEGLCLSLEAGERLVVRGPSGSGKSLLLRSLAGIDPLDAGTLSLDGRGLLEWGGPAWRAEVLYVHQTPPVLPGSPASLWEGLRGLAIQRERTHGDPKTVAEALALTPAAWTREWSVLSGGERQRAALAIAVAAAPRVLLLDEPTAALDDSARELAEAVLAEHTAIWVSHDAEQASRIGARTLDLGEVPA